MLVSNMYSSRKKFALFLLMIMTSLSAILSLLALFLTFIIPGAFMMFDNGSSPAIWILFVSFITIPLVCLVSLVISWRCYRSTQYTVACYVSLIPLINVILLILTEFFRHTSK